MEPDQRRKVRAEPVDASGRRIEEPVRFAWILEGLPGEIHSPLRGEGMPGHGEDAGSEVVLTVFGTVGKGLLRVRAGTAGLEAEAEAVVTVVDESGRGGGSEGVPEPEFVEDPGGRWRSRMQEDRWQVNTSHPDFRAVTESPALKLRYLAMLFGKEVVERSHRDPRLAGPLEQLVEVVAFADRSLTAKRTRRPRGSERS